jgi:serine phosphatase RsbU (regulator of sigma subunit)
VSGRNIPCSEIGGDFFSVTTIDEGVVVAIADVCGKGISAAIMASRHRMSSENAAENGSAVFQALAR